MLKKVSVLSIIVLLSACASRTAQTPNEEAALITVSPEDTVQILVRADGAPGMYLGEDGDVHGFYVDLEKMVMERMGQSYNFVAYEDIMIAINGINDGTYHIALSVPDLADFRAIADLSIPYEELHFTTFVQKGNSDITGSSKEEIIASLHGKKVGVQAQGHIYQVLRDIEEIELIEYPTTTKALAALNRGEIDAVPDVERIGHYYSAINNWEIETVGEPIITHNITTGFTKAMDSSLLERYNAALSELIADGSVKKLYDDFLNHQNVE